MALGLSGLHKRGPGPWWCDVRAAIVGLFLTILQSATASAQQAASPHEGDLWTRDVLTGNWDGERSALEDKGLLFGADTIDEILGNPSGGTRQGVIYEGRLELLTTINLEKTVGWTGATFHANGYQIRGRGLSANDLGDTLEVASNIEAERSFRLFDLWVEQSLLNTALSIRAGQIAADDEFITSQTASLFINSTFGWPAIVATDLPDGGPAYPLATPGVRVKYAATDTLSAALGVFNGDPAGASATDPQSADGSGTAFRFGGAAFAILEGAYAINQDPSASGLAASYKIGAWFHSGPFPSPPGNTMPQTHQNDAGLYLVADQALLHTGGDTGRLISVFARLAIAPSDRNEVSLDGDAGVNFTGFIPGRDDDVIGVAASIANVGTSEAVLEVTYHGQITPWWSMQPDLQFIRHPGGGIPPTGPGGSRIPDATVFALRSAIVF